MRCNPRAPRPTVYRHTAGFAGVHRAESVDRGATRSDPTLGCGRRNTPVPHSGQRSATLGTADSLSNRSMCGTTACRRRSYGTRRYRDGTPRAVQPVCSYPCDRAKYGKTPAESPLASWTISSHWTLALGALAEIATPLNRCSPWYAWTVAWSPASPMSRSYIIIPARLASTRLPRKLLLRETGKIGAPAHLRSGVPGHAGPRHHVWRRTTRRSRRKCVGSAAVSR